MHWFVRIGSFWREALRLDGSATPYVAGRVILFGLWSVGLALLHTHDGFLDLNIDVGPYEALGAVLGLLLVLRTNSGNDRWYEGRKLWGGIVNQSRNLGVAIMTYGRDDPEWRLRALHHAAAFGHIIRRSLRGQRDMPEVTLLIGEKAARRIAESDHMPTAMSHVLAQMLHEGMDQFGFLQADVQRARLIDHIGGCERIAATPLPLAFAVMIRRFLLLFLITLPFALFGKISESQIRWLVPLIEVMVAYPLLSLDKIGAELQNPFLEHRLNHLPLDRLTAMIERNLMSLRESSLDPATIAVTTPDFP